MKKLIMGLFLWGVTNLLSSQTISFDKTTIDYGNIAMKSDGHQIFTFKNTGDKPLILSNVKASCGCTIPEWEKSPILPGKTGKIKVGYDTNIKGNFRKSIEVYSNDPKKGRTILFIQGNVTKN